ncbi:hypothetical protein ND748_12820, partial [Frankia sp. AiPs1]
PAAAPSHPTAPAWPTPRDRPRRRDPAPAPATPPYSPIPRDVGVLLLGDSTARLDGVRVHGSPIGVSIEDAATPWLVGLDVGDADIAVADERTYSTVSSSCRRRVRSA